MASGFRLADPAEYRRGVILGLTLAEVLTLLVFLLLLSSSAIIARKGEQIVSLKAKFGRYDSLLAPVAARASRGGIAITDTDALVSLIVRGAEADQLRVRAGRDETALAAARAELAQARSVADGLRAELSTAPPAVRAIAAKAREDDALRSLLHQATSTPAEGQDAVDAMRGALVRASAGDTVQAELHHLDPGASGPGDALKRLIARDASVTSSDLDLTGQNAQMRTELARLKGNGGSGLPYCWTTIDGHPLYMMKVVLQDDGVIVHDVDPRPRPDDPLWSTIMGIPKDSDMPIATFIGDAEPIRAAGVVGRCRYAVLAVDGTGVTNKPGYKFMMGRLWSVFTVHETAR